MTSDDFALAVYCPKCAERGEGDIPLEERTNSKTLETFLGCVNYPRCKYTQELPEWVKMRRIGAPNLPGFDL